LLKILILWDHICDLITPGGEAGGKGEVSVKKEGNERNIGDRPADVPCTQTRGFGVFVMSYGQKAGA
jgi:hypothetical protein